MCLTSVYGYRPLINPPPSLWNLDIKSNHQIKSNLFARTQAHTSRNNKCKTKWKLNEYNNYKQKVLAGLKGSKTALTW